MPFGSALAAKDYEEILEAAGSMLIACDPQGTVRVFNPAAERLLGWRAADVVGRCTPARWHDRNEIVRRAAELSEELGRTIPAGFEVFTAKAETPGGESREWTFVRKDGARFPVHMVITAIRDAEHAITGYLGTAQDISQRVRAEQERNRWFDLSLDILCVAGNDGSFKRVNPAFCRILGWSETELLDRPYLEFVHPDDQSSTVREVDRQTAGLPTLTFENRYRCKDGSWRILSWTSVPQPDGSMFATARDVTDLRRAEAELRHSRQDLAITLRSIGDGVIAMDSQRRVTRLNPVAEQMTGWSEADAVGRPIDEVLVIVHETTRLSVAIPVDEVLATGTVQGFANHTLLIARDGSECAISDSAALIRDDAGEVFGVVLVLRDASCERDLERELHRLNSDLERRVAERTKELAAEQRRLRNGNLILESAASEATLPATLELIVRFVTEEGAATRCGVLLLEEKSDLLRLGAQRNLPEDFDESLLQRPRGTQLTWIWRAVETGKRVVEKLSLGASSARGRSRGGRDLRTAWAEPIVAGDGSVLGVFVAYQERSGPPDDEEATCVECACSLARVAIEREHARAALESSRLRYRTLLERIPANVFVYDRESLAYLAVSDHAIEEYGYSREEFSRMTIADIRPADDLSPLLEMLRQSGTAFENRGLWRHLKKDGTQIDVEITTHGLELEGRSACIVLAKDVTEQRRAENALRRSEALNQAILQASLDCIVTMNEAGVIVEFNRAAENAFGYSRDEAEGRSMKELLIPADLRGEHERGYARYLATGEERIVSRRVRTAALRRDGEKFPVELTVVPVEVGGERHFTAFIRDVTAVLRAEQELRRTTELLQAITDGTTDAVFVKDRQGRYLLFNGAAARLTGRSVEEVLGENDDFVFGNEHGRKVRENDLMVMQSNQPQTVEEELTAAGTTRIYHAMKAPLRDPDGQVVGLIGVSRDVTERKRMESALRASEERYRSIVERSPDMTFVIRDHRISFVNRSGIELLEASSAEEILGRSQWEFFHTNDRSRIRRRIAALLSGPGILPIMQARMVTLRGSLVDVDVQASSYLSDHGLETQVVCRDVSLWKRAEQALKRHVRHAEFSAAIGIALSQAPTTPEMLQSCVDATVAHLDAAVASVWVLNEQDGALELRASAGPYARPDDSLSRAPVGEAIVGRVAATKLPYHTNSAQHDSGIDDADQGRAAQGLSAFAGYPLLIEGRCLGVVAMFAREALEKDTLEHFEMAASRIAQSIQQKRSEAMLADLNKTLEQRVLERTLALAESEQFNRATLDALSAHVAVVDCDGNIVATNAEWRNFAVDNQAAYQSVSEGANYLAVCDSAAERGSADAAVVADALRAVLAGERTAWQHEYPCHSPTERRWFICQVTRANIRQRPHAVVAHENVTGIKRVQEELREAKEKAMQASLAKSEFLATMSHELRSPLNGILGMNDLLLQTDLNELQRRFVEACASSGKLLKDLINDVLDVSKIEAGKLELDPRQCEIEAVVYDVVDIFSNAADQKGLALDCRLAESACVSALVDDNRLRQILVNLVGNAIKFTSSGRVSILGERIENGAGRSHLRIEVTDTGIGIPGERIDRLFKAFSQVDSSTTRQFGGTGLGLSICKQLVELMNGRIGVESQVGVGSSFWFEIPLGSISQPAKSSRSRRSLEAAQAVIVGCSNSEFAHVAECMANWGCLGEEAETLDEAFDVLDRLAAQRPSDVVVVSSFRALERDSVSLSRLVDRCPGRVVALLTTQDEPSAKRMRSQGILVTLQDPARPSEFYETLISALWSIDGDEAAANEDSGAVQVEASTGKLVGHLLVAEDNRINQMYMVELLKLQGCTCDVVANGEEALSALERGLYDLVLMDCQMPEMDGFTAAREIRKREANAETSKRIPIVAVTANALQGDREKCLKAGMDAYVSKPIAAEQLRSVLESFLESA